MKLELKDFFKQVGTIYSDSINEGIHTSYISMYNLLTEHIENADDLKAVFLTNNVRFKRELDKMISLLSKDKQARIAVFNIIYNLDKSVIPYIVENVANGSDFLEVFNDKLNYHASYTSSNHDFLVENNILLGEMLNNSLKRENSLHAKYSKLNDDEISDSKYKLAEMDRIKHKINEMIDDISRYIHYMGDGGRTTAIFNEMWKKFDENMKKRFVEKSHMSDSLYYLIKTVENYPNDASTNSFLVDYGITFKDSNLMNSPAMGTYNLKKSIIEDAQFKMSDADFKLLGKDKANLLEIYSFIQRSNNNEDDFYEFKKKFLKFTAPYITDFKTSDINNSDDISLFHSLISEKEYDIKDSYSNIELEKVFKHINSSYIYSDLIKSGALVVDDETFSLITNQYGSTSFTFFEMIKTFNPSNRKAIITMIKGLNRENVSKIFEEIFGDYEILEYLLSDVSLFKELLKLSRVDTFDKYLGRISFKISNIDYEKTNVNEIIAKTVFESLAELIKSGDVEPTVVKSISVFRSNTYEESLFEYLFELIDDEKIKSEILSNESLIGFTYAKDADMYIDNVSKEIILDGLSKAKDNTLSRLLTPLKECSNENKIKLVNIILNDEKLSARILSTGMIFHLDDFKETVYSVIKDCDIKMSDLKYYTLEFLPDTSDELKAINSVNVSDLINKVNNKNMNSPK